MTYLIQLDSGYFCAAVTLNESNRVVAAAPILNYMLGWYEPGVVSYARKKGWSVTTIE